MYDIEASVLNTNNVITHSIFKIPRDTTVEQILHKIGVLLPTSQASGELLECFVRIQKNPFESSLPKALKSLENLVLSNVLENYKLYFYLPSLESNPTMKLYFIKSTLPSVSQSKNKSVTKLSNANTAPSLVSLSNSPAVY